MRYAVLRRLILSASLTVGGAMTSPANAQQPQVAADLTVTDLTSFAQAYVEIDQLRFDLQTQLARATNKTPAAQAEIRARMQERRQQILRRHGLTEEAYSRVTFLVSTDAAQREAFRELIEQVSEP